MFANIYFIKNVDLAKCDFLEKNDKTNYFAFLCMTINKHI